jgi:hypothetical protein
MPYSTSELDRVLDAAYPTNTNIAHATLLHGDVAAPFTVTFTAWASTGYFTAPGPLPFANLTPIKISRAGQLNGYLSAAETYWIVTTPAPAYQALPPNSFYIANSYEQAQLGESFIIDNNGSGIITVTEQQPTGKESLAQLLVREINFIRKPVSCGPVGYDGGPNKQTIVSFSNTGTVPITYRHCLILFGGNDTIGSSAGVTGYLLLPATAAQAIGVQQLSAITINLRLRSI